MFAHAAEVYTRAKDQGLTRADTAAVAQVIEASISAQIVRNGG